MKRLACLVLAACSGPDPCPHVSLEVRAFDSADVNGNTMMCSAYGGLMQGTYDTEPVPPPLPTPPRR